MAEAITRFGFLLRKLRKARGMTQQELAKNASCHPSYISDLERGTRLPSPQVIDDLCDALKLKGALATRLRLEATRTKPIEGWEDQGVHKLISVMDVYDASDALGRERIEARVDKILEEEFRTFDQQV